MPTSASAAIAARALAPAGAAQPAELAVEPHHHDVERGGREVPVDPGALRHVADPAALLAVGAAMHADVAGDRLDQIDAPP